jgi:hypothetical protein
MMTIKPSGCKTSEMISQMSGMYNIVVTGLALSCVEVLQLCIHCSCQLQDVSAGRGKCTDSSECIYRVGTESRGKIKNMEMGPVIDMKGLGDRR